jgi:hypothetical protein
LELEHVPVNGVHCQKISPKTFQFTPNFGGITVLVGEQHLQCEWIRGEKEITEMFGLIESDIKIVWRRVRMA